MQTTANTCLAATEAAKVAHINSCHEHAVADAVTAKTLIRSALDHSWEAGKALIELREEMAGSFSKLLKSGAFTFSASTAYNYIKLAKLCPDKAQLDDLTCRKDALKALGMYEAGAGRDGDDVIVDPLPDFVRTATKLAEWANSHLDEIDEDKKVALRPAYLALKKIFEDED